MITTVIIRINIPLVGSLAKECTEVRTPERTKNVPNNENPNAMIASNIVQLFIAFRLSVTARE